MKGLICIWSQDISKWSNMLTSRSESKELKEQICTCVCPPALSSMFVVANVAELGKQVKKEDTVLEIPWANSSWHETTERFTRPRGTPRRCCCSRVSPGWDGLNIRACLHRSWPVRLTRRNPQTLWPPCLLQCQGRCSRPGVWALEIWEWESSRSNHWKILRNGDVPHFN